MTRCVSFHKKFKRMLVGADAEALNPLVEMCVTMESRFRDALLSLSRQYADEEALVRKCDASTFSAREQTTLFYDLHLGKYDAEVKSLHC